MSRSIRGNTGTLYQEVAQAASQIAGPLFDDSTGTLVQRIRHCIDNPISGGIALSQVQVKQLQWQLDVLARGEM